MPDIFTEAVDWFEHRHHPHTQTPAPGPVTLATAPPKENPVSIAADLREVADKLETIGDDAVGVLNRVNANPETKTVLGLLDELTGLNVAPGIIGIVAAGLSELVSRLKTAAPEPAPAEAAFTPAGPTVAGQA